MITEWVNKEHLKRSAVKKINKNFKKIKPYPHFALKNFFNKDKVLKLKNAILKEKFERQDKDLFSFSNTKELKYAENKLIKGFFKLLMSNEFIDLMKKLTGETKLNHIDMHAHIFKQGDYLLFHDDLVEDRKIAYIVYLSQGFKAKYGGRLQLFDIKNPLKPAKEIVPAFNSFVCFKVSKKSLHAVEEIKSNKQRITIGGWFYGN